MRCPRCNTELAEENRFCSHCGYRVSSTEASFEGDFPPGAEEEGSQNDGVPSIGDMRTAEKLPSSGDGAVASSRQVGGRYIIEEKCGEGGMGVVFRAKAPNLGITVAIKRLRSLEEAGKRGIERFFREGQAFAGLNHQNIVRIYELDEDEEGPYIVTDFVDGPTLSQFLVERGALPLDKALDLFLPVVRAINHAHRRSPKIIHRDIKPANILLDPDPSGEGEWIPKLTDFGLARRGGSSDLSLTGVGMGTLAYMAPEQRRSAKEADERADIYALGKTLVEMLTGEVPDTVDLELVPEEVREIVRKCLKTRPEERYFSADELLEDLQACRRGAIRSEAAVQEGYCPECGLKNPEDARYCEGCGGGLFTKCPNPECAHEIRIGAGFCRFCGLNVREYGEIEELLMTARSALDGHRYERVVRYTNKILGVSADHEEALELKKNAQDALDKVTSLKREISRHREAQDYESERALLDEAIVLMPHDEAFKDRLDQIEGDIVQRDTTSAVEKGNAALSSCDFEKARSLFQQALKMKPDCEEAVQGHAKTEENIGRIDELMAETLSALEEKQHERVVELAENVLAIKGDHELALECHSKARENLKRLEELGGELVRLQEEGELEAERIHLEEAIGLAPGDESLKHRLDEVVTAIRKRMGIQARDAGLEAMEIGNFAQARHDLKRALQLMPGDREVDQALLQVDAQLGEISSAVEKVSPMVDEARRLLEEDLDYEGTLKICSEVLEISDRFSAADQWSEAAGENEPIIAIRRLREEAGRCGKTAKSRLEQIPKLWEKSRKSEKVRDFAQAIGFLEKLIEIEPDRNSVSREIRRLQGLLKAARRKRIILTVAGVAAVATCVVVWSAINVWQALGVKEEMESAVSARDYAAVLAMSQEHEEICGRPLVPDSIAGVSEVEELYSECSRKIETMEQAQQRGDVFFENGSYADAIVQYAEVVAIQPVFGHAKERHDESERRIKKIGRLLESARKLLDEKKLEDARIPIEEILVLQPFNADAAELKRLCDEGLARYREAMTRGDAAFQKKTLDEAGEEYRIARDVYPGGQADENLAALKQETEEVAGLLQRAKGLRDAYDYQGALRIVTDVIQNRDIGNRQAREIKEDVAGTIVRIGELFSEGKQYADDRDLESAYQCLKDLVAIKKDHDPGASLLRDIEEKRKERDRLVSEAREALERAGKESDASLYVEALDGARKALALDSLSREAEEIRSDAIPHVPPDGFVTVAATSFIMGISKERLEQYRELFVGQQEYEWYHDEQPAHRVSLDAFWISRFEVTCAEYCEFLNAGGPGIDLPGNSHFQLSHDGVEYRPRAGEAQKPIVFISWDEASAYCTWYGRRINATGHLPTEAQWELAAAYDPESRQTRIYPWGNEKKLNEFLGDRMRGSNEVGSCTVDVSPWGVADLGGNVAEWCQDWYSNRYYQDSSDQNPQGPATGIVRAVRGGSWRARSLRFPMRTTGRRSLAPGERSTDIGFRVVAEISSD